MRQQKNPFPRSLGVMRGIITPGSVSQGSRKRKDRVVGTGQGRGQNRGQKLSGSEKDRRISWDRSQSAWDKSTQCRGATTEEPRTEACAVKGQELYVAATQWRKVGSKERWWCS